MLNLNKGFSKLIIVVCFVSVGIQLQAQRNPIFKAANIKSNMLKVASWQFVHSNGKPEYTWTNAAFYTGVFAAYETTKSTGLIDSLTAIGKRNNWLPGKRYDHADDIAITQTYIDLYRINKDELLLKASIPSKKCRWFLVEKS